MNISDVPVPHTWDEMLRTYVEGGWEEVLLTFMFDQLPGGRLAVQSQQRVEVERIYRHLLPRFVRRPSALSSAGRLPVWLSSPDYPVFKHCKQALRDVTINDGQHVQVFALLPPRSRLRVPFVTFIQENQAALTKDGPCCRIHAQPVTHDDAYVYRYVRKSEERGRIDADAFFVLPRTMSEVREGPAPVGRQSSIFAAAPLLRRG